MVEKNEDIIELHFEHGPQVHPISCYLPQHKANRLLQHLLACSLISSLPDNSIGTYNSPPPTIFIIIITKSLCEKEVKSQFNSIVEYSHEEERKRKKQRERRAEETTNNEQSTFSNFLDDLVFAKNMPVNCLVI